MQHIFMQNSSVLNTIRPSYCMKSAIHITIQPHTLKTYV